MLLRFQIGYCEKRNAVIDDIVSLARSSETARPFEVAGQLLKTQSEIAKGLVDLHELALGQAYLTFAQNDSERKKLWEQYSQVLLGSNELMYLP